jgi:hypothetical protein
MLASWPNALPHRQTSCQRSSAGQHSRGTVAHQQRAPLGTDCLQLPHMRVPLLPSAYDAVLWPLLLLDEAGVGAEGSPRSATTLCCLATNHVLLA